MRVLWLPLLAIIMCLAFSFTHNEKAQLAIGVVMAATLLAVFFVTYGPGERVWPASFFGAALGALALAQVGQVGRVGWFVAAAVFLVLCGVAVMPGFLRLQRELAESRSRLRDALQTLASRRGTKDD